MLNPERHPHGHQHGGSPGPPRSAREPKAAATPTSGAGAGRAARRPHRQAMFASTGGAEAKSSDSTHRIQTHADLAPVCLTFPIKHPCLNYLPRLKNPSSPAHGSNQTQSSPRGPEMSVAQIATIKSMNFIQMLLWQPPLVYALTGNHITTAKEQAGDHEVRKVATRQHANSSLQRWRQKRRRPPCQKPAAPPTQQTLTLSMPLANSNRSAKDSPAAIRRFTSSEERRPGSLWKCLGNSPPLLCRHKPLTSVTCS